MNAVHAMRLNSCWHPDATGPQRARANAAASGQRIVSGAALALAFAVWMAWSVLVVQLPAAGFRYSTNQLFWLAALPALSGATLQLVSSFALPVPGGRGWLALSVTSLLLTALGVGFALHTPDTPFELMVALALSCGLGSALMAGPRLRDAPASIGEQATIMRSRNGWLMSWLAIGSLGSFIGLTVTLPLFAQHQFAPDEALAVIWLGPLLGMLACPLGHWLAGRLGVARVTTSAFVVMTLGTVAWWFALPDGFALFLGACALLFAGCGIGSGSTGRMFARVFAAPDQARAAHAFAGAVAAYGGFVMPKLLGTSISLTGSAAPALLAFAGFYLSCLAITWWHYGRRFAPTPC